MKFEYKIDKKESHLLKEGEYDFEVIKSENATSRAGNEMIKLSLLVNDNNGKSYYVYDYLLSSLFFKLKHFCESVGLNKKLETGELDSIDCYRRNGKAKIGIKKGDKKEDGTFYNDKNYVVDYLKPKPNSEIKIPQKPQVSFEDDQLPF